MLNLALNLNIVNNDLVGYHMNDPTTFKKFHCNRILN
jgi:hypothetical protein